MHHVTYRLKWLYNVSSAGSLYAQAGGIFAKHGLDVSIMEGSPERDAIKELELGHAQFGVASADQVLRARSKGAPVVVLAQLFQENPLIWIFRPKRVTIANAQDLRGKTIGITFGGNDETILKALMAQYNIPAKAVRLFSVRYDYTPFYQGEVDLWPVYKNAQAIIIQNKLQQAGEQIDYFSPAAQGIKFVANSVVTTRNMLEERPILVQDFVGALLEGWAEAVRHDNEDKAVAIIHQFDKDTSADLIAKQLAATTGLIRPLPDTAIGSIDIAAWIQTEKMMLAQRLIPGPVPVEKILITDLARHH